MITTDDIKRDAAALAQQLRSAPAMTPELRKRFIDLRAALFRRGIYDPVLVRFDSATAPQASLPEIGEELTQIAASLV